MKNPEEFIFEDNYWFPLNDELRSNFGKLTEALGLGLTINCLVENIKYASLKAGTRTIDLVDEQPDGIPLIVENDLSQIRICMVPSGEERKDSVNHPIHYNILSSGVGINKQLEDLRRIRWCLENVINELGIKSNKDE